MSEDARMLLAPGVEPIRDNIGVQEIAAGHRSIIPHSLPLPVSWPSAAQVTRHPHAEIEARLLWIAGSPVKDNRTARSMARSPLGNIRSSGKARQPDSRRQKGPAV